VNTWSQSSFSSSGTFSISPNPIGLDHPSIHFMVKEMSFLLGGRIAKQKVGEIV
jgi:hypothetical protein